MAYIKIKDADLVDRYINIILNGASPAEAEQTILIRGGISKTLIASGAGLTVIKGTAGIFGRVVITTQNTGGPLFYDHASAASGGVVAAIPANAPVGSKYDFDISMDNGIVLGGSGTNPGMTIIWS